MSERNFSLARQRSRIEDHFEVNERFEMRGPRRHPPNPEVDRHDWFNVFMLIPICVLNYMNWSFSDGKLANVLNGSVSMPSLWTGDYFDAFFYFTVAYFVIDAAWVLIIPECVGSPKVILIHHICTLLYMMIPFLYREYGWLMGACLSVEVNTWFLITRRLANKEGQVPFSCDASTPGGPVKIKIISVFFYITWVIVRLIIYPAIFYIVVGEYLKRAEKVHSYVDNALLPAPFLQAVFCGLNFKWSFDLLWSKMRAQQNRARDGLLLQ